MKKESTIKLDPETGEIIIPDHLMDLWDNIEEMMEDIPDKRTKKYQKWKTDVNTMIKKANNIAGHNAYKLVK